MKGNYTQSLKKLDYEIFLAEDMLKLIEKYNSDSSYAQNLFFMANSVKNILRLEVESTKKACTDYKNSLIRRGFDISVVEELEKSCKTKTEKAEKLISKIEDKLSLSRKI